MIETLVERFLVSDGKALFLVPNQKIMVLQDGKTKEIGRDILPDDAFQAISNELAPGENIEDLVEIRHTLPYSIPDHKPVEVRYGKIAALPAIMIWRTQEESGGKTEKSGKSPGQAMVPPPMTTLASGITEKGGVRTTTTSEVVGRSVEKTRPPAPLPEPEPEPEPEPKPEPESVPEILDILETPVAVDEEPSPASGAEESEEPPEPEPSVFPPAVVVAKAPKPLPQAAQSSADSQPGKPIDRFLRRMVELEASDVHFSSNESPFFRIHGEMRRLSEFSPMSSNTIEAYLRDIIPERNLTEFQERSDTDFAYEILRLARFRANVYRDRMGVGAVFRQIPCQIASAEELHLPPSVVAFGDLAKGLVLVTGPTGSGKSTTLAAIIDYVNRKRSDHIITIEDPIEFVHPNKKCLVNQREVNTHTSSFKAALRAALREDPDVVLVGEMRDLETIAIAIETAVTGHLVFGTLHTNSAVATVDRMVDQFPADRQQQIRVMLADALKGVVSQMLLKRKGGGRVAALEVLIINSAISNLIREAKTSQLVSVMQTGKGLGMSLMNDSLLGFVIKGVVEAPEAYAKTMDKPSFLELLHANEIYLPGEKPKKKDPK